MVKGKRLKVKGFCFSVFLFLTFNLLPLTFYLSSYGCKAKVEPGTVAVIRQPIDGVTIAAVHPSEVEEYFETSGTIKAKTISRVASKVMGTVTSLRVKEGDRVRAGQ